MILNIAASLPHPTVPWRVIPKKRHGSAFALKDFSVPTYAADSFRSTIMKVCALS
jgi:hypothetical protein